MKADRRAWHTQESMNNLVTVTQNEFSSSINELWYESSLLEKQPIDEHHLEMDPFLHSPPSSPDIFNNGMSSLSDKNSYTTETSYGMPIQSHHSALSCDMSDPPFSISPIIDSPNESLGKYDSFLDQNNSYQILDTFSLTEPLEKTDDEHSSQYQCQMASSEEMQVPMSMHVQNEETEFHESDIKMSFQSNVQKEIPISPVMSSDVFKSEQFLASLYKESGTLDAQGFGEKFESTAMIKDFRWFDVQLQHTATLPEIVTGMKKEQEWLINLSHTKNENVNQGNVFTESQTVECLMHLHSDSPSDAANCSPLNSFGTMSVINSSPADLCVSSRDSGTLTAIKKKRKRRARNISFSGKLEHFSENKKQLVSISERHEDVSKATKQKKFLRRTTHSFGDGKSDKPGEKSNPSPTHENNRLQKYSSSQMNQQIENPNASYDVVQPGPSCSPSRFCHICTRTTNPAEIFICGNVKNGTCRKVICHRCLDEIYFKGNISQECSADWECTHCRKECPPKAQCFTYRRVNQNRRINTCHARRQRGESSKSVAN